MGARGHSRRSGEGRRRPKAPRPPSAISRVAGRQQIPLLLSASGLGSTHDCKALIASGRVALNGKPVRSPRARAHPERDVLTLDGAPVTLGPSCRYLLFHKPYRVLSAFTDPEGRATSGDYIDEPGVYAVGRLDYDSEGLMLLTDDGWLNHRLTHPDYFHEKTYWVQVEGEPQETALAALREGVLVKGKRTRPAGVSHLGEQLVASIPPRSVPIRYRKSVPTRWLQIVLREGRKRQVRHMTAAVDHPTLRLIRVGIGPLRLEDLAVGVYRPLSESELAALRRTLGTDDA